MLWIRNNNLQHKGKEVQEHINIKVNCKYHYTLVILKKYIQFGNS